MRAVSSNSTLISVSARRWDPLWCTTEALFSRNIWAHHKFKIVFMVMCVGKKFAAFVNVEEDIQQIWKQHVNKVSKMSAKYPSCIISFDTWKSTQHTNKLCAQRRISVHSFSYFLVFIFTLAGYLLNYS